jgi:hypothetical protein
MAGKPEMVHGSGKWGGSVAVVVVGCVRGRAGKIGLECKCSAQSLGFGRSVPGDTGRGEIRGSMSEIGIFHPPGSGVPVPTFAKSELLY